MPSFDERIGGDDVDQVLILLRDLGIDLGPVAEDTPWLRLAVVPLLTLRDVIEDAESWASVSPAVEAFMDCAQKVADWVRRSDPRDGMALGIGDPLLANPRTYAH